MQQVFSGDTDAEPVAAPGTDIHLWGALNVHDHESVIAARADEVVARSAQAGLVGERAYIVAQIPERNSAANITSEDPHPVLVGASPEPLLAEAREQSWSWTLLMLAVVPEGSVPQTPTQAGLLVSEGDGELPAEDDVMWFSARLLSAE